MSAPLLLDLYCGAGGAAKGYADAGFHVVGVDIEPQENYPYEFVCADALEFLQEHGHAFDVRHASPPCHDHTTLSSRSGKDGTGGLLATTITALRSLGGPWVVENVVGADMPGSFILCGSMFGLGADCRDGKRRQLRRHRRFLTDAPVTAPWWGCDHAGQPVGIYGTGGGGQMTRGYKSYPGEDSQALGVDWMTRAEMAQAIPPAYTEWIGAQLMEALGATAVAA